MMIFKIPLFNELFSMKERCKIREIMSKISFYRNFFVFIVIFHK
jgi:hypothetical protein